MTTPPTPATSATEIGDYPLRPSGCGTAKVADYRIGRSAKNTSRTDR